MTNCLGFFDDKRFHLNTINYLIMVISINGVTCICLLNAHFNRYNVPFKCVNLFGK